ncbi:hypothetical protein EIL50_05340 [bacterium NHP-B]|nr:hypothetical protein EIL50_05340 [bacterium NHP-B]
MAVSLEHTQGLQAQRVRYVQWPGQRGWKAKVTLLSLMGQKRLASLRGRKKRLTRGSAYPVPLIYPALRGQRALMAQAQLLCQGRSYPNSVRPSQRWPR